MAKDHPPTEGKGCIDCHAAVRNFKALHNPTAQNKCDSCHKIQAKGGPAELTTTPDKLCTRCHDTAQFKAAFVHGPVAIGACGACHNPHGSNQPRLVRTAGQAMCVGCHSEMQSKLAGSRFKHKPLEGGCVSCHNPHSAAHKYQIRAAGIGALCANCHGKVLEQASTAKIKHTPISDKNACMTCHDAHASQVRPNLKAEGLAVCMQCHDKPQTADGTQLPNFVTMLKEYPNHHGPIRDKDCGGCHQVHGSNYFRLLKADYPREFYAPFRLENFALCFQCHESAIARDEKTLTLTDFRDGDRNLHFVHVNKSTKGRTCRSCHETHASNLPNHIRKTVPFGNWELPVNFTKAPRGGSCAPGCHAPQKYERAIQQASSQ